MLGETYSHINGAQEIVLKMFPIPVPKGLISLIFQLLPGPQLQEIHT